MAKFCQFFNLHSAKSVILLGFITKSFGYKFWSFAISKTFVLGLNGI